MWTAVGFWELLLAFAACSWYNSINFREEANGREGYGMNNKTVLQPRRPVHMSDYAEVCLHALVANGLGEKISEMFVTSMRYARLL